MANEIKFNGYPYIHGVEALLGVNVTEEEGLLQFVRWVGEEMLSFSPRLPPSEMHEFCKRHYIEYETYHILYAEKIDAGINPPIKGFW